MLNFRRAVAALCGLGIAGFCAAASAQAPSAPATGPTPQALSACLQALRPKALAAGVTGQTWDQALAQTAPMPDVLDKLNHQPEFKTPIWDYMAALVDDERVADGLRQQRTHADTLSRVQQRFGVDAATVVAVWGVESNFGQALGRTPLLQALPTLSCAGRRTGFFQTELMAVLRILQAGHVAPDQLVGSWAGAFGQTQFMPTTYERLAVDFDGDGRRDLTGSVPDALASTANFLQKAGWRDGLPWGFEVRLPAGFDVAGEGRRTKRPASHWAQRGVQPVRADLRVTGWGADLPLGLMTPAGPSGPSFLVSRNFDALFSYNAAESYGLAIAHLSDRLRLPEGHPHAFATPWPTDDPGLSRAQRRELQTLLTLRGHDVGAIDGLLGERSRAAIRAEQARLGHVVDGRAGQRLLQALSTPTARP